MKSRSANALHKLAFPVPQCNSVPRMHCSCLFSRFRNATPLRGCIAPAYFPHSAMQSRSAYALLLLVFPLPQCNSVPRMHCSCLFSRFRNATPLRGCIAQACFPGSAMQSRSAYALHKLAFPVPQCNSVPRLHCSCLFSRFRNAVPLRECIAPAYFPGSAMQPRSAAALLLLTFPVPQCNSAPRMHCSCLFSRFRNAIPLRVCIAQACFPRSAMQSRSAYALHKHAFPVLQCNPAPQLHCSCLFSRFRNALPLRVCIALACFLASAMHFRRTLALLLLVFPLPQC